MEHTEYHQLSLWDEEDRILRTDFNSDNAKTEAALADLTEAVANCGNCKIVYGTYTGTGKYGSQHPNSLTFAALPLLIFIMDPQGGGYMLLPQGTEAAFMCYHSMDNIQELHVAWSGNQVSWWGNTSHSQANNGREYHYLALLATDETDG